MKTLFVTAVLAAASTVSATTTLSEGQTQFLFTNFITSYNKNYETRDVMSRYKIFMDNLDTILKHNADSTKTYKLAINQFADLKPAEFAEKHKLKLANRSLHRKAGDATRRLRLGSLRALTPVDWSAVQPPVLPPVQDQGNCGSCYSFSSAAAIEAALAIGGKGLTKLSEQQMVDCSQAFGNAGCEGGLMTQSFDYLQEHPLVTSAAYPYTGKADSKCLDGSLASQGVTRVPDYTVLPEHDEAALMEAVEKQPVAVALNASPTAFMFYSSGVVPASDCGGEPNHAVTLVGHGVDVSTGIPYLSVRNSWSEAWGMNGHILLEAGKNTCGISGHPFNVIPHPVTV